MKKLTLEKAQALLEELDPSMPETFAVLDVAYSKRNDGYYVRWFDEMENDIYDDGVAKDNADGAKVAYSFRPSCSYSVIWFNEGEDGAESPVVSVLSPEDVKALAKSSEDLVLLDRA